MKTLHIILFIAGIALQTMAYGQTQKGNWSINGTIEYDNNTDLSPHVKIYSVNTDISGGYFLYHNLQSGIALAHGYLVNGPITVQHIGPLLYVKYYTGKNRLRAYPYLAGGISYHRLVTEGVEVDFTQHLKATLLRGGVGMSYFVTPVVAIEALATYQLTHYYHKSDERLKSLNVKIGLGVYF